MDAVASSLLCDSRLLEPPEQSFAGTSGEGPASPGFDPSWRLADEHHSRAPRHGHYRPDPFNLPTSPTPPDRLTVPSQRFLLRWGHFWSPAQCNAALTARCQPRMALDASARERRGRNVVYLRPDMNAGPSFQAPAATPATRAAPSAAVSAMSGRRTCVIRPAASVADGMCEHCRWQASNPAA